MLFRLRQLEWRMEDKMLVAQGINHHYAITDTSEGYRITWHDQVNDTHNHRYFKGALEAMEWAQKVHYPKQLEPWVINIKE